MSAAIVKVERDVCKIVQPLPSSPEQIGAVVKDHESLTIDAEFKRLIPAPRLEEFKRLEANILRDGCQEPLSVWKMGGKNILLDGHMRG